MSVLLKSRPPAKPAGAGKPTMTAVRSDVGESVPNSVTVKRKRLNAHLVSVLYPDSPEAERYRGLRHVLEQMHTQSQATTVGVCSPAPGEGKSITAINLSGALAQDPNSRVLLVEVDVRRPAFTVEDYLALGKIKGPGLVDATQDEDRKSVV